ncbi:MAG: transglutaminase-like domain-containing protein, partial [bacterium]|nr:transglutaminase-like domain-containing protein [bacterium]
MKPHPPFFSAWLTAGLVLIIAASGQVLAGSYFLISKDGETYGYSTLEQFDRENGLLQNHLETRILFSRIGNLPDTHYAANEFYSRQEKRPFTYEVTIDYKTKSKRLTCSFPRLGEAQILGETHGVSRKKVLSIPEKFVIFDNNLFGQFELIFSYLPQEVGDFSIPVFVPQVANMRRFDARFMGNKEIVVMGKKQQAALFYCTLIPLTFKVWIGSEGRLLRLEIPAMGVTVERVKRGYIRAFEACHHSNMMQADLKGPLVVPELLESAAVSLKLAAEKLPFSKRKLTGTRQRFTGSLNEENLEGTFYLGRRLPTEKSGSIPSPQEFALAGHLAPSINQESDLPQIKTMALDIAGETTGREELACRIAGWVADNIQFKPGPLQAIKTLQRKQGPVAGFANLTVALLKASGIPSRTVQGLAYFPYGSGRFTWHIWVEFFGTDNTWHSLDPFMDESRSTDNLHIVLPPITNISGLTAEITIISPVPPEEILLALPERDFSVPDQTTSYFALQVGKQQFGYLHTDFQQSSDSRESGQSQYLSHLFMDANELG